MALIAMRSILHDNRLYEAGETLPCVERSRVAAWLEAGSARYETTAQVAEDAPVEEAVHAEPPEKKPAGRKAKK